MNQIVIKGRLTADPKKSTTPSGVSVCNFSVAVRRPASKNATDFFNCVAWADKADFIGQYFNKGKEILLSGPMQSRDYTDKQGVKRIVWEVNVKTIDFCGSKEEVPSVLKDAITYSSEPF